MRSISLAIFAILAACGGGGGGSDGQDQPEAIDPFTQFANAFIDAEDLPYTPEAQLLALGSAQYLGQMRLALPIGADDAQEHYLGNMQIEVAFDGAADPIVGTVTNFDGATGTLLGRLDISDGFVDANLNPRTEPRLDAEFEGSLTKGSSQYQVTGEFFGDVLGQGGAAITGIVGGNLERGAIINEFGGSFVVTQTD